MSNYIDRDKLLNHLSNDLPYKGSVKRVLLQAKVEDVAPVIHVHWIRDDETQIPLGVDWYCSLCGQIIHVDGILTAIGAGWYYCPKCGAKWRGLKMYKGRYVATVIIDFKVDDSEPDILPFEEIKNTICNGNFDAMLTALIAKELGGTGDVNVTRTYADFYQVSEDNPI